MNPLSTIHILAAQERAFRRQAKDNREQGQAAEDPYLMGKACAYLEVADAVMAARMTLEQQRKARLEILS